MPILPNTSPRPPWCTTSTSHLFLFLALSATLLLVWMGPLWGLTLLLVQHHVTPYCVKEAAPVGSLFISIYLLGTWSSWVVNRRVGQRLKDSTEGSRESAMRMKILLGTSTPTWDGVCWFPWMVTRFPLPSLFCFYTDQVVVLMAKVDIFCSSSVAVMMLINLWGYCMQQEWVGRWVSIVLDTRMLFMIP